MKALPGFFIFVLAPLALVLWVYLLSKKQKPINLPAGKTDLISILRAYHQANGSRALPIIAAIALFWVVAILIRAVSIF